MVVAGPPGGITDAAGVPLDGGDRGAWRRRDLRHRAQGLRHLAMSGPRAGKIEGPPGIRRREGASGMGRGVPAHPSIETERTRDESATKEKIESRIPVAWRPSRTGGGSPATPARRRADGVAATALDHRRVPHPDAPIPIPSRSRRAPTATSGSPRRRQQDRDDQPDHPRHRRVPYPDREFRSRSGSRRAPTATSGSPSRRQQYRDDQPDDPRHRRVPHPRTLPICHEPEGITAGPDGNLWFTEYAGGQIGMIDPTTHAITEFAIPNATSDPYGIAAGPDGNLWFTEYGGNEIGMINPTTHAIAEFAVPDRRVRSRSGSRRAPTATSGSPSTTASKIGMINPTTHAITEFPIPTDGSGPDGITVGPDGNLWFTEINVNTIGMLNPQTARSPEVSRPPTPRPSGSRRAPTATSGSPSWTGKHRRPHAHPQPHLRHGRPHLRHAGHPLRAGHRRRLSIGPDRYRL